MEKWPRDPQFQNMLPCLSWPEQPPQVRLFSPPDDFEEKRVKLNPFTSQVLLRTKSVAAASEEPSLPQGLPFPLLARVIRWLKEKSYQMWTLNILKIKILKKREAFIRPLVDALKSPRRFSSHLCGINPLLLYFTITVAKSVFASGNRFFEAKFS